jgi:hypothetical protein
MINAIIQKLPGAYNGGRVQPSGQPDLPLMIVASDNSICNFHVSATLGGRSRSDFLVVTKSRLSRNALKSSNLMGGRPLYIV